VGLDLAHLRAGGVTDPSPTTAESDDDSPKQQHPAVTGTSSEAARHSPVPVEGNAPAPHPGPRVTDPTERNQ
jgi:hypothetical protein